MSPSAINPQIYSAMPIRAVAAQMRKASQCGGMRGNKSPSVQRHTAIRRPHGTSGLGFLGVVRGAEAFYAWSSVRHESNVPFFCPRGVHNSVQKL